MLTGRIKWLKPTLDDLPFSNYKPVPPLQDALKSPIYKEIS